MAKRGKSSKGVRTVNGVTEPVRTKHHRGRRVKKNKVRRFFSNLILICAIAVFIISAYKLINIGTEYQEGRSEYEEVMDLAVQYEENNEKFRVDFDKLKEMNADTIGWIRFYPEPSIINYPVVQAADNDYYLDHLFDGTSNRSGSIFMDFRNAAGLTDRNTFIYGHNMRNGSMFAALTNYGSQSYYEEYPELTLVTPSGTWSLQAFSGYVTPGNSDCYQLEFRDDAEFEAYLERVRLLSDFTADVAVTAQDRIVTLSTCTYDYEDARYVLHCKLVPMQ